MVDNPVADQPAEGGSGDTLAARLRQSVLSAFGVKANSGSARIDIEDALANDEASGAAFSPEEREMLRAILKFGDMRVGDVMVPRADIEAVEIGATIGSLLQRFREAGHSRMPIYRDTLDDPVGMVHLKDVTVWLLDKAARSGEGGAPSAYDLGAVDLATTLVDAGMMRPLLFVPPSMPARALLAQMQARRMQMALVIDEYGGTDGLVSIEDIVEIIVGEIDDEHDEDEDAEITKSADGSYVVAARADLEDVARAIGPGFDAGAHDDVETIGGLLFSVLGRVPVKGELVQALEGYEFEVLDADPRRVKRVRIRERRRPKAARARERAQASGHEPASEPADVKPEFGPPQEGVSSAGGTPQSSPAAGDAS